VAGKFTNLMLFLPVLIEGIMFLLNNYICVFSLSCANKGGDGAKEK
jgi:hypothetical protein